MDLLNLYSLEPFRILLGSKLSTRNPYGFVGLQRLKVVVNLRIFVVFFWKKVRVSQSSIGKASNPHELASIQCSLLFMNGKR